MSVDLAGVCTGPGPCDTHPTGHGGDNFVTRGGGFDPYLRAIINALKRSGHPESEAVQLAIGTIQRWARGEGNVTAATRARAAASLAHWETLKAKAHALTAAPSEAIDLAGPHGYSHGWVRVAATDAGAVERASRAVMTDGHAMLHGPGMVQAAQKVIERVKAAGHRPTVRRVDVAGVPHVHVARAASMAMTAEPTEPVDLAFNASLHPRAPKGTSTGGQFTAGNSASAPPKGVQANVRDFQRRKGLAQTGRFDAATQAAVKQAQAPATGGSGKKSAKGGKGKSASSRRANHAATAAAVNRLSNVQRAQFRILRPAPPKGYHWTADNHLVRSTPQARAIARILRGH